MAFVIKDLAELIGEMTLEEFGSDSPGDTIEEMFEAVRLNIEGPPGYSIWVSVMHFETDADMILVRVDRPSPLSQVCRFAMDWDDFGPRDLWPACQVGGVTAAMFQECVEAILAEANLALEGAGLSGLRWRATQNSSGDLQVRVLQPDGSWKLQVAIIDDADIDYDPTLVFDTEGGEGGDAVTVRLRELNDSDRDQLHASIAAELDR